MKPNLNEHVLDTLSKSNHLNHLKQLQAYLTTLGHAHTHFYAFKLIRFCTLTLSNPTYARLIFDHIPSLNTHLFTAMITAYAAHPATHPSALSLFRHMLRSQPPRPNHFIFPHALKTCPESCAAESLHAQIVKSGIMLANVYGELGKWDEVRNVWRTLKQQKSYKVPGCSWIEVDDQVHQFYSLDKSNPKTEDLYIVLESLVGFRNEVMGEP
ncbi:hypothetical protein JHK84_045941 [Glycine max]|nr:hypothetical protein JHK84_045941 [Glycine max]